MSTLLEHDAPAQQHAHTAPPASAAGPRARATPAIQAREMGAREAEARTSPAGTPGPVLPDPAALRDLVSLAAIVFAWAGLVAYVTR